MLRPFAPRLGPDEHRAPHERFYICKSKAKGNILEEGGYPWALAGSDPSSWGAAMLESGFEPRLIRTYYVVVATPRRRRRTQDTMQDAGPRTLPG